MGRCERSYLLFLSHKIMKTPPRFDKKRNADRDILPLKRALFGLRQWQK